MKRRLAVFVLLVLLLVTAGGLVAYTNRSFWAWMVRRKYGALNADARNPQFLEQRTVSELRTIYSKGYPGWTKP